MKRSSNLTLILFFTLLTIVMTAVVDLTWEKVLRDPFFAWVERRYPGEENRRTRRDIQQRVEHFTISITVDVVVVTLLLRLVNHKQRELVESEERYRALFEHASDGIGVVAAADHRLTEANNRFCEILDCTPQEVVGRDVREIVRPTDRRTPLAEDEVGGQQARKAVPHQRASRRARGARVGARRVLRQRRRHPARRHRPRLRPVLHDAEGCGRDGAWPLDKLRDHTRPRRDNPRRECGGGVRALRRRTPRRPV